MDEPNFCDDYFASSRHKPRHQHHRSFTKPTFQADKLRAQQELERLQQKYIGTGHPDTTSWEWKSNIMRDTYSSLVGHPPMLAFLSLAQGEPAAKTRFKLLKNMVQPCGPPPARDEDED
ncbi:splicing factor 3B subunit 5 [Sporothrix brasiliensis 5110]|uniref:Splicing factor 3B subunit 5 n=1 Tax=Sporothrix brasiliensis 5110 TaxID=1398154 RepID=A0A0C2IZU9_9PEZI|nr:splicing factor 3B subunit 5 [Sporothrix brasiliensis 5110]KIH90482.1 splicing factor 3B subunit 5 [Sporothrix brasiliensis 5110]